MTTTWTWRAGSVVLAAAAGPFGAPVSAQALDLAPPPPTPAISELNLVPAAIDELDASLERLRLASRAATGRQVPAIDAMIALRELARLACAAKGEASTDDWSALDSALRLAESGPAVDVQVRSWLAAEATAERDEALRRFRTVVPSEPRALADGEIAIALRTLLAALEPGADATSAWPRIDRGGAAVPPPTTPELSSLRERLAVLKVGEALRDAAAAMVDAAGPPAPASQRLAAGRMLDLMEAVADSALVDRTRRTGFDARAERVCRDLADFAATDAMPIALLEARESAETADVLRTAERLRPALGDATKALAGLPGLLLRLDTEVAPDASPPPWRSKRAVSDLLELVAEGRAQEASVKGPELVLARKDLLVECRKSEKSLLASLAALVETSSPLTDPAMASLLRGHQRLVEDLRWLGVIDAQAASMATVGGTTDQALERSLRSEMHEIATRLASAADRPDALQARLQLERQSEAFGLLPGLLPGGEMPPRMVDLLGAERAAAVREALARARRDWVAAWGRGEGGGDAARRMLAALRAMRCAEAMATMREDASLESVIAMLARWGGWSVPPAALRRMATEEAGPLLAALDAIGQAGPGAEQLRALERRTASPRLALRLSQKLDGALDSGSSAMAAALGPLIAAPPDDAWGAEHFVALARIAVVARAWLAAEDEADADRLRAALDAESDALLQRLGEWRGPVPTLR